MEKKINIAELLKDCPSGMELNCISYDNVSFDKISSDKKDLYPIFCYITDEKGNRSSISFTEDGCESKRYGAKCVIFPKGKTTWEKFVSPCKFKDGDILATDLGSVFILNTHFNTNECYGCYTGVCCDGVFYINEPFAYKECCNFATEEEKEELFQTIKDNGYKWNAETKTLEKLIVPKFKVGNIITNGKTFIAIGYIDDEYYYEINRDIAHRLCIKNQDEWELVPNKFDINTLKTFDQVLVRLTNNCVWMPKLFSHYDLKVKYYSFVTLDNMGYPQCIPYKGNEHLSRTTDDCDEFYRVWEK